MSALRVAGLLLLATLAGCGSKKEASATGPAEGKVLPGSVSDAMLPYDTATSAPPLAAPEVDTASGATARSGGPAAPATEDSVPQADTVPEAAAT